MCGRLTLRTPPKDWIESLLPGLGGDADPSAGIPAESPRYNIAPTQTIWALAHFTGKDSAVAHRFRWGLVPRWAKDLAIGNRMINARSETVDSKPSFRDAWKRRRCLIPADGYYEWRATADGKQPYLIESAGDDRVLAMAGLWECNDHVKDPKSDRAGPLWTCTIMTTRANSTTVKIHDRMPVLIDQADFGCWLDPEFSDAGYLKTLLGPAREDRLKLTAVSKHVNNARNDDVQCIEPVSLA